MIILSIFDTALPLTNPVLKFLLILAIILFAPIILNKIKIPHLLGLIIAGAVIGPNGFNVMERDSSIILSGTAGLLYIIFLAGLEIDMADFKKNRRKSIVFGLYTFAIPMFLGTLTGIYLLDMSVPSSVLLASMFASHTLIAYPLVSKMGVAKNRAVNITVGGTVITDILALLVLAVIVGMTKGEVNTAFWIKMTASIIVFGLAVILLFPLIGRWFFKRFVDPVAQYIFVLMMVFLGAFMAEMAGIEAIIGAFLAGLALNRLIPGTSPLMNRIEFVGNAIFIPFFLIGVGMLIDYRVFFKDVQTIYVAIVMITVATTAKFLAAWFTQKTYGFSADERRLIFGLSNAQAAATLAAVLVGYNIILDFTPTGEPIRLLDDSILNGTILMILFTCTLASFAAQKGAQNIALLDGPASADDEKDNPQKTLIAVNDVDITDELIDLAITTKPKKNRSSLFALSIVDEGSAYKQAKKTLSKAAVTAAATDHLLHELLRYDVNFVNGTVNTAKEHKATDLILGVNKEKGISNSFFANLTEGILPKSNITTLVYKPLQPLGTVKRHLVVVPENAEREIGFPFWLVKIWNIAANSGGKLVFYAPPAGLKIIKEVQLKHPIESEFIEFTNWEEFLILARELQPNDNMIIVLSRKDKPSYNQVMTKMPAYLNKYFTAIGYILIYPMQVGVTDTSEIDFSNPTIIEPLEKLDEIGNTLARLFRRK